jgi:SHS family lactate transporter-like MFS transporter
MDSGPSGVQSRADQRNAVIAGFLGWTLDAFDFFILVMVVPAVAKDFHTTVPAIALTLMASLMTRPIGAVVFGLLADRFGRRLPLMLNVVFYSLIAFCSGLAPTYKIFFMLRLLYGIGMGGEWGVGASLTMESVPVRLRGLLSGLLQEGYVAGYLLAALSYYLVFPRWGWRPMFFIGGLPALLALFIRSKVKETEAWRQNRTDWPTYARAIGSNWKRLLYMVLLMVFMNSMAHGTQDMFPTYLIRQLHYPPGRVAIITMVAMLGALSGGVCGGYFSDLRGRRRSMMTSVALALALIPLWMWAPNIPIVLLGAFLMQFMVQSAWGVIPAHINELAPAQVRGLLPGFVYQVGVLGASSVGYLEARFGEHVSYTRSMSVSMVIVIALLWLIVKFGPEAKGVEFVRTELPLAKGTERESTQPHSEIGTYCSTNLK